MTWTYTPALLGTTNAQAPLMQVRRLIGDVLVNDQQLQDEEINWALSRFTNIYMAAWDLCRSLAAQLARQVDLVQGELKTNYSQRSKQYLSLSFQYYQLGLRGAVPYAGGISIADKTNVVQDPDRVPPEFGRHEFDNLLPVGPVGEQTPVPGSPDSVDTDSPTFP